MIYFHAPKQFSFWNFDLWTTEYHRLFLYPSLLAHEIYELIFRWWDIHFLVECCSMCYRVIIYNVPKTWHALRAPSDNLCVCMSFWTTKDITSFNGFPNSNKHQIPFTKLWFANRHLFWRNGMSCIWMVVLVVRLLFEYIQWFYYTAAGRS